MKISSFWKVGEILMFLRLTSNAMFRIPLQTALATRTVRSRNLDGEECLFTPASASPSVLRAKTALASSPTPPRPHGPRHGELARARPDIHSFRRCFCGSHGTAPESPMKTGNTYNSLGGWQSEGDSPGEGRDISWERHSVLNSPGEGEGEGIE